MRNLFLSSLVLAFMCVAVPVQAGLTLNLDPTTQEVFFTGSSSGTPDRVGGGFFGDVPAFSFQTTPGSFFAVESPFLSGNLVSGVRSVQLFTGGANPGTATDIFLRFDLNTSLQQTPTGTGTRVDTTNFVFTNSASFPLLLSFAGQTLNRVPTPNSNTTGEGFESVHIVSTNAVPEPGSLTVLALAGLSLVARRRRKC